MTYFGPLGFLQPWFLAGLIVLPVLWYLLRLIPPQPHKVWFPPLRLLLGLDSNDQTLDKSPWWLLLLRILLLALIIIAFARPVWNPAHSDTKSEMNTVIIVDNGWASAAQWEKRKQVIENLLSQAEQSDKKVLLTGTVVGQKSAKSKDEFSFQNVRTLRERIAAFIPTPYSPKRMQLLRQLRDRIDPSTPVRIVWLSDGLDYGSVSFFSDGLKKLVKGGGTLKILKDNTRSALGLYAEPDRFGFKVRISRSEGGVRSGLVYAWDAKGGRLGEAEFKFANGKTETFTEFRLPHTIRNQVSMITIAGENSAGAVYLLDSRALRYKVGLISGTGDKLSQPLLSPLYYIEKALTPYAEVVSSKEKNISLALFNTLEEKPTVMMFADIGRLTDRDVGRLETWVKKGGILVRFAGVRMSNNKTDKLLPLNIRGGGRSLGGTLTWGAPQGLASFGKNSPFYGLDTPSDIKVQRQILTDPSFRTGNVEIWAELKDGTPLVTARKLGNGWLVFYHVTANLEWSNLPISGLFVEMLKRLTELSRPELNEQGVAGGNKTGLKDKRLLPPFQVLNGFGKLGDPALETDAVPADQVRRMRPKFGNPPGYYGLSSSAVALNVFGKKTILKAHSTFPKEAGVSNYFVSNILFLFPWFIMVALILLLIDTLIWLTISKRNSRVAVQAAVILLAVSAGVTSFQDVALADTSDKSRLEMALKASTGTHLAYVITGNKEIDRISRYGLSGLSKEIARRTAVEPKDPIGVDLEKDDLSFFPILYWPIHEDAKDLSDKVLAKVDAYMKLGGMILFDTRDYHLTSGSLDSVSPAMKTLRRLFRKLNIPRLAHVSRGHVVTKSFYLLKSFPGRWDGGKLWAEASTNPNSGNDKRVRRADGVSSILITSNDFAGAWALDENYRPLLPTVPGGELQREMAFRSGINIVMYALTGNYKADQVHVPALLQRLGQ